MSPLAKSRWLSIFLIALGLTAGLLVGHFYWRIPTSRGQIIRENDDSYKFINPIIGCEIAPQGDFTEFKPLEDKLSALIKKLTTEKELDASSVYFRTLNSGRWIELGSDNKYRPASLLKVLTAIGHYKIAESDPSYLEKKILYTGPQDIGIDQSVPKEKSLKPGTSYTIEELIEHLLFYSDNQANNILLDNIDNSILEQAYRDLDISIPDNPREAFISTFTFSTVFKALYGSTYLTRNLSEKMLSLMAQADFTEGIVAGVPQGTVVSHKFGVRSPENGDGTSEELHDCGIVYYPKHPYFLCVMTRGKNEPGLKKAIQDISQSAYEWIDNYFKNPPR